jgi:hypothetical protein
MFNEMSIVKNLHFNQKFNYIEGFEDCGSLRRTCNVANHTLVFMLCGLHRKWKQPVALKRILMPVGKLLPLPVTWEPATAGCYQNEMIFPPEVHPKLRILKIHSEGMNQRHHL